MKRKMTMLILFIVTTLTLFFLFIIARITPTSIDEVTAVSMDIECRNNKNVDGEVAIAKKNDENVVKGCTNAMTKSVEIEEYLATLIAESKASATEKTSEGVRFVNGEWSKETYTYIEYKSIPVDSDAPEVAEYIQIARMRSKDIDMPDDVKPTVEIHGERIVVTFPYPTMNADGTPMPPGPDYYAEVIIDIRTKTVITMGAW